jgi:nucleoside-diphosphate-sugar epimerase
MLAERLVLQANGESLATCALRPHLIWGPHDHHLIPRLIARAKSGRLRRVGTGKNLISMSYVENAAAAHVQAADHLAPGSPVAGQAYFINEPEPVPLWDWINTLLGRAGLPPVTRSLSLSSAWTLGAMCEALYSGLRFTSEPPMTRFLAAQLGGSHYYSIRKAQRDFGYTPIVSVEEGLRKLEPELRQLRGRP